MLNLAMTTLLFGLGSGAEAMKSLWQRGVYFQITRVGATVVTILITVFTLFSITNETLAQFFVGFIFFVVLTIWLIPYHKAIIQIRNGSHREAREELEKVLKDEGYAYDISVNEDNDAVYHIPELGKTKLTVKEKGTFIKEDYSERTELSVVYTGYGNPFKETMEAYMVRMRDLRVERSFSRTAILFGLLSLIMLIVTGILMFQAWHSPMEVPNQRLDEVFD